METSQANDILEQFAAAIEKRIPAFLENPDDLAIADGNVVLVTIDGDGRVFGRFWGDDLVKQRRSSQVAWTKATQVLLTATSTGRYEELVYAKKKNWWEYGIPLPEFIGWEGGMPAAFEDGTPLAIAFSGFRGDKDCELIRQAVEDVPGITLLDD